MLRSIALFAIISLLAIQSSYAQLSDEQIQVMVEKVLKEKFRYPVQPQDLQEYFKTKHEESLGNPRSGNDILVSDDPLVEAEVHAAINPTNEDNIVVSPIQTNSSQGARCPVYYTDDFGATWKEGNTSNLTWGTLGGGDPVFAYDANGKLYFSWIDASFAGLVIRWAYSTDGGATWQTTPSGVIAGGGFTNIFDKQWMAVDMSNSQYKNTVYACMYEVNISNNTAKIGLRYKRDTDTEFSTTSVDVSQLTLSLVQFSSIDVDNNGHVHVSFIGSLAGNILSLYHAKSTDGGQTFSSPLKISDLHVPVLSPDEPTNPLTGVMDSRLYPCPHIRIDKSGGANDGNIYATWTSNGFLTKDTDGLDIYFSKSTTGGSSWSTPVVLNDDTGTAAHQYYSSLNVNNDGVLLVSYYDRRDDSMNLNTHYYLAISRDGGDTWEDHVAITSQPTDFSTVGSQNNDFGIGEYNEIISTSNYAIPVWADGRTNNGNLEIYAAFIPLGDSITGIEYISTVEHDFSLEGPFPNPVSSIAEFTLKLESAADLSLDVYDLNGRMIMKGIENKWARGTHQVSLDMSSLANGEYLIRLSGKTGSIARKFVLIK